MNLVDPLLCLFSVGLLLFVLLAMASPLEALGWWSGWSKRQTSRVRPSESAPLPIPASDADYFIVYLTAIGGISAEDISKRELTFLAHLQTQTPTAEIIHDVFPFSVTNNPLNGERQLSWLWQKIHNSRMGGKKSFVSTLIFVRNLLQVGVSSDPRYGPIYNVGVAREIALSLLRHGYRPGSGKPITVMGWSGGGQIAVGVVPYLHQALDAPVYVVSVGGVMADDPGVAFMEHMLHLQSAKDNFPDIGKFLFPGRWPMVRYSGWNQAVADGRITIIDPGPMIHTGRGDYFDYKAKLPDGRTHVEKTTALIGEFIRQQVPTPTA
ncbi:MAG: hypothetical protein KBE23_09275 [Chloroflexi bacterium]|nr:hypothetical protein [Chloroflexota bacterium]MBP7042923.1 hypothetical protein [Chloroflexota bacterium]